MLKNKHILIGVTGGIAAYKIPLLVREIKKAGADVRIVMTEVAKEFVAPVTLSTLSGNQVVVGTFPDEGSSTIDAATWHIRIGQWAHVMLIAPATANVVAKLAHGYADNAVTTLALSARCPIIVAPSMDSDMLQHPTTQENITKLREIGYLILPPEVGELASGLMGAGRLPEISHLVEAVKNTLENIPNDFYGKKILVTAGPTREAIDPVRYISNYSSGKMGFALANVATQRGAKVTLVTGPTTLQTPRHVQRIDVESAEQMYRAVMNNRRGLDAILMAAAVADYSPVNPLSKKIKKEKLKNDIFHLELKRTKDILQHIARMKNESVVVGFALETNNGLHNAKQKLREKKLDLIILNNPLQKGAGFDSDTNIVTIVSKKGKVEKLERMSKFDIANEILDRVLKLL